MIYILDLKTLADTPEFIIGQNDKVTIVLVDEIISENDVSLTVRLTGVGASAQIIGCFVGKAGGSLRLKTFQLHEAPGTTSDLLVKSVLGASSSLVYRGAIHVYQNAQKTNAYQRNESLMLTSDAKVETKPTLEIAANDVRCTHGATIGPISEEELWYCLSRGISKNEARHLIITGFLESALSKISDTIAKEKLRMKLWQLL